VQYLKLSYFVTPFFGDASRRLLTPSHPEDVRLLNDSNGKPLSPGQEQAILPAGRRVRVVKVEFPTAWAVTERVLYTPRTQPWVYLEVEGAPPGPPLVLVLRPQLDTNEEFRAELGRYLSPRDVAPRLAGFSESVQEAVRSKRAVVDMPAEALEMSWGYPETVRVSFQEQVRQEEWIYPSGARRAFLSNGRVSRLSDGAVASGFPEPATERSRAE